MPMTHDQETVEWPRELWMAERERHDQAVVSAVLSQHATIARYEGDTERDRDFHKYIDADIHESTERYHKAMLRQARIAALREAAEICTERSKQFRGIGHRDKLSAAVACRMDIEIKIAEIKGEM